MFFWLVAIAFVTAGYRQVVQPIPPDAAGPMDALAGAMVDAAGSAVTLAPGLIGVMALFLGLMKVAEQGAATDHR